MITNNKDIIRLILNKLDDKDLVNFCSINKSWRNFYNTDKTFWINRICTRFSTYTPSDLLDKYQKETKWPDYYIKLISRISLKIRIPNMLYGKTYEAIFEIEKGDTYKTLLDRYASLETKKFRQTWKIIRCGFSVSWNTLLSIERFDWVDLLGCWRDRSNEVHPLNVYSKAKWKCRNKKN